MQFPKELRQKESTRRWHVPWGLNEVQFPKKLRPQVAGEIAHVGYASIKCSPRRNRDSME